MDFDMTPRGADLFVVPEMALRVIDRAVQAHGAAGVSQDTPLAASWAFIRTLRIADGPDEVHRRTAARLERREMAQRREMAAHS